MSAKTDIVICEPLRTPVGKYGGALKSKSAADLGAVVLREILSRTSLDPSTIDDVILGNCSPTAEAPAIGRVVALDAGLPVGVPGLQIDRRCGSGLEAVLIAASKIRDGMASLIIAGGTESMSNAPYYSTDLRWGTKGAPSALIDQLARARVTAGGRNFPVAGGMLETAENLRREYSISREKQDEMSVESHRRASAAVDAGIFAEEIVPVEVSNGKATTVVDLDEHIRPDVTLEGLAKLKPIMLSSDADSTVTAGNASGQNDGAAMCIVTTAENAEALGLRPLVRLVSAGLSGVQPATMGIGPIPATKIALDRAGISLEDVELIELNEAFAAQVLACLAEWKLSDGMLARLNVHGSGISLGHPVGATGARILATLSREMVRRQARYGLETMCIGGGQGLAAVFERVDA